MVNPNSLAQIIYEPTLPTSFQCCTGLSDSPSPSKSVSFLDNLSVCSGVSSSPSRVEPKTSGEIDFTRDCNAISESGNQEVWVNSIQGLARRRHSGSESFLRSFHF